MLKLSGTRGTLPLLGRVQCSRFRIWSRQYLTRKAPLLQLTPPWYITKVKTTPSTCLRDNIYLPGYLTPHADTVESKFNSINIFSQFFTTQRHFSTSTTSRLSADAKKSTLSKRSSPVDDGYVPVYKFQYIVHVYALCRLKIFQTALITSSVPLFLYLGLETPGTLQFWGLIGTATFAGLMLCVMGEIFRKFVGRVYYHPGKETVCVSHLTFWGSRKDDYFELSDIVPISDTETNLDDIYLKIRLFSDPSMSFLISFRLGEVLNKEFFSDVFGFMPK